MNQVHLSIFPPNIFAQKYSKNAIINKSGVNESFAKL